MNKKQKLMQELEQHISRGPNSAYREKFRRALDIRLREFSTAPPHELDELLESLEQFIYQYCPRYYPVEDIVYQILNICFDEANISED